MRRTLGAVVLGSLAVALAASACTTNTGTPGPGPSSQAGGSFVKVDDLKGPAPAIPGAKQGGTVTILGSTDFDNADPQANYRGDGILVYSQLITRTLTGYYEEVSADGKILLKLGGDLATSTGKSEDSCKKWSYTLRDNIKFQDGTAITSKDIAYGISRSFDGQLANGPQYIQKALAGSDDYETFYPGPFKNKGSLAPGIATPDDKTLTFTFPKPFCDFPLAATLLTTVPVPVAKDAGPAEYEKNIIASGPYQIEKWTRGEKMTLVRNASWDPNSDALRHNYPDKWVFDWSATDPVVASKRFVADSGDDQFALQWDRVPSEALPDVLGSANALARVVEGDTVFNIYLSINTTRVTDLTVRQALQYAINRDALLKLIGGKYAGSPSSTITAPTVPGFKKYDAYPAPLAGDPDKAKSLLAGKTPSLKYCYRPGTTLREQAAAANKEALERAGFQIVMAPTDAVSHYTFIGRKGVECDLMSSGWGQDYPSNSTVMTVLMKGGEAIHAEGNNNWSYLDVPAVNTELDRLGAEADIQKAAEGYMALDEKVMREQAPLIPLYYLHSYSLVGSKLGGAYLSTTWGSVSLQNVYIKS